MRDDPLGSSRLRNPGGSAGLHPCPPNWRPNRDRVLTDLSGSHFTVKTVGEGQLVEAET